VPEPETPAEAERLLVAWAETERESDCEPVGRGPAADDEGTAVPCSTSK
jgi:hypothetical protein